MLERSLFQIMQGDEIPCKPLNLVVKGKPLHLGMPHSASSTLRPVARGHSATCRFDMPVVSAPVSMRAWNGWARGFESSFLRIQFLALAPGFRLDRHRRQAATKGSWWVGRCDGALGIARVSATPLGLSSQDSLRSHSTLVGTTASYKRSSCSSTAAKMSLHKASSALANFLNPKLDFSFSWSWRLYRA